MKNLLYSAIILMAVASCEKKPDGVQALPPDSPAVPDNHKPVEASSLQTCYLGIIGKDSIFLSVDDNLGTIVGKLRYKNFEKDSSIGDLVGIKSGDTLKLNYSFHAEGTSSEREIYFLQKDAIIIEGIGDHDAKSGAYTDYKKIKFEEGSALKGTDCKTIEKKFSEK